LPALAKAKAKAQNINCLSNLKQWAIAQTMYVDESDQAFPATKIPNGTPGTPPAGSGGYDEDQPNFLDLADVSTTTNANGTSFGRDAWFNALPPYIKSKPLWQYALSPTGPPDFNKGNNIYHCPPRTAGRSIHP